MRLSLLFIFLAALLYSSAQNLVADSSFEYNANIPLDYSSISMSSAWNSPNRATPDLFCKCGKKQEKISRVNVPKNGMGQQDAHTGTCYAGIFAVSHGYYREYLQTTLNSRLEKGKEYELTMYVSLADYAPLAVDKLGVCFLMDKVKFENSEVITSLRPLQIPLEEEVGTDTEGWHELKVRYKAQGGENTLLIGSFNLRKLFRTGNTVPQGFSSPIYKGMERDAYYYIDDVSLHQFIPEVIDTTEAPENPYFANLPQDSVETVVIEPDTLNNLYQEKYEEVLAFRNVTFKTGEAVLSPLSYPELNSIASHMASNPKLSMEIYGHTDNAGEEKKNRELSLNRAKSVAEYLIAKGVIAENISYQGFGSTKPVDTNTTEEGRKKNRRVEFVLKKGR